MNVEEARRAARTAYRTYTGPSGDGLANAIADAVLTRLADENARLRSDRDAALTSVTNIVSDVDDHCDAVDRLVLSALLLIVSVVLLVVVLS